MKRLKSERDAWSDWRVKGTHEAFEERKERMKRLKIEREAWSIWEAKATHEASEERKNAWNIWEAKGTHEAFEKRKQCMKHGVSLPLWHWEGVFLRAFFDRVNAKVGRMLLCCPLFCRCVWRMLGMGSWTCMTSSEPKTGSRFRQSFRFRKLERNQSFQAVLLRSCFKL